MAAENETRLISALVRQEALRAALDRGVRDTWFHVSDDRMVFAWMHDYHTKYGRTPTAATLKDHFPAYRLIAVTDPAEYFVDQLVAFNREQVALRLVSGVVDALDGKDTEKAFQEARDHLEKASSYSPVPVRYTDLSATVDDRWESYLDRKAKGSRLLGLETGYPVIDEATLGLQPEQLIVVLAEPKRGKTTLCMNLAIHAHAAHGVSPLLVSFEMSRIELGMRHDAIRSGIPLSSLLSGALLPVEEDRFADMMDDLETRNPFVLSDAAHGVTVSAVAAQVEEHKPDLIIVDGCYMMLDEVSGEVNTPQALTNITRGMKRLAQTVGVPVIISTQALSWKVKRGRMTGDSAGWSSSFAQDADVMLGLEPGDSDTLRRLRIILSRNSGLDEVDINFDYQTGDFGQVIT